mgnify:CR=1 FL=1
MANKKRTPTWVWLVIVVFVILLIIIYIGSLGKFNISNVRAPKEFKDNKEQAKRRHEKLKTLIEKKEALKYKLTKRFKLIYFAVRFSFVAIWATYIIILIHFDLINSLSDAMDYSNAAILGWITLNFLTFGSLSSLNEFIHIIKMKLESWIWGKYINLDESIVRDKSEKYSLEMKIG